MAQVGVNLGRNRDEVAENMQETAEQAIKLLENGTRPEDFYLDWYEAMSVKKTSK